MTTYLIMILGYALLLAMTYTQLRTAPPDTFIGRALVVAAAWFTLCLVVLA